MVDLRSFLLLILLVYGATARCSHDCFAERAAEMEEDLSDHECRSCKAVTVKKEANCPEQGYECDEDLKLVRNEISAKNRCVCSEMKCADPKTALYVGGALVGKIHCRNRTWTTREGSLVPSVVCAKKIDVGLCGVCKLLPNIGHENNPYLTAGFVRLPEAGHPCPWVQCGEGAFASNSTAGPIIYRDPVWFSCTRDGSVRMMNPDNSYSSIKYNRLQCMKKRCGFLPYQDAPAPFCGTQYSCYKPHAETVTWPNTETIMACDKPKALRLTALPSNTELLPQCFLGEWNVADSTNLFCIDCAPVVVGIMSVIPPVITKKDVTCPGKHLRVELQLTTGGAWAGTPVTSVFCNEQFVWDSKGTLPLGGFYASLKEAIQQGIPWRVMCSNL